jgi:hypothetical protein
MFLVMGMDDINRVLEEKVLLQEENERNRRSALKTPNTDTT